MRGELGLEENRPEMAEGFFNYLRGLLVTKTRSLAVKSCLK